MRISRLRALALLSATFPVTSVTAAALATSDSFNLFTRDASVCGGNENLTQCGQNLPSTFCCPVKTTCLSLNNTGTAAALCCPPDSDCSFIQPVSCDISLQDPVKYPTSYLKVGDLTKTLGKCGSNNKCCPLGFDCSNGLCKISDKTKEAPTSTASSSSTPTSTSSSTPTSTNRSSPINVEPTRIPNKFPAGAVLAGFFPGILLGLLIALGIFFFLKRRDAQWKAGANSNRTSKLFGGPPPRPKISDPIYQTGMSERTDFMHARSASGNSIPPEKLPSAQQAGVGFGGYYQSNNRPVTGSTGTLVSPEQQARNNHSLGAPFETPTRPSKPIQGKRVRALFSKSPSLRSKGSTRSQNTVGQNRGSLETIDILMRTQPGFGLPPPTLQPLRYDGNRQEGEPQTPPIAFADVYRAAGVSPPKSEFNTTARPSTDTTRF
jgi:hypothetical protein